MPAPMRRAPWPSRFRGVRVVDEPRKGLVVARETGRRAATRRHAGVPGCRLPCAADWLERGRAALRSRPPLLALSGPYRFYDWDWWGRSLIRAYDFTARAGHALLVKYLLRHRHHLLRRQLRRPPRGARRDRRLRHLDRVSRRGHQPRPAPPAAGKVALCHDCYLYTSARRYRGDGKRARCSGCTCGTSRPSSCTTGRKTDPSWM